MRRAARYIADIGACGTAGFLGAQYSIWHALGLIVLVGAYGIYCFWDGMTS